MDSPYFYIQAKVGITKHLGAENWRNILQNAGLKIVFAEKRKMTMIEQIRSEMQLNSMSRSLKAGWNFFKYHFTEKEFRHAIHGLTKDALHVPKGLLNYLGYGIYVGKKPL